jgi:hypothetical protein
VADSETGNTTIKPMCTVARALLEKGRRDSWTGSVSEPVLLGKISLALLFWRSDLQ